MMASDDTALHHTVQEDKTSGQYRKSGSSKDSPGRLSKSTINSQDSNCSKSSSQSGSAQFNYSSDFHDNASRTAVNGSKNSICSEENNCGTSQKYYCEDFHSDSSENHISEVSGSYIIPLPQKPETKERNLPEKKKKNDAHTKGGKMLPKKKPQQKNLFIIGHTINAQKKNNIACRLLSARNRKIKEMKNEAAVLRNKLETLAMENKSLKRLQSQHLKAIRKYEHAEINLPDLLATQSNEVRTLRAHLRASQEEERRASKKLRDVQAQLLRTTDAGRALQKLCEDKELKEKEELQRKLTSLTQKLEASDKKTQDLEKQLSWNIASFRRQLSVENKKIIEAQSIRANLQVEIESLKLKLKERERELSLTNVYAHRMRKGQPGKADSCSSPKVVKVNKAIQVNISLKAATLRKPEPEVSPMIFHEEIKEVKEAKEASEENSPKILPEKKRLLLEKLFGRNRILSSRDPNTNSSMEGLQSEEICPSVEKNIQDEHIERHRNRRERQGLDFLQAEFEIIKKEPGEKQKSKDHKEAKEGVCDVLTTARERHRKPSTSKKEYVFSEAIQNLHQGYPSTGPKITCSRRPRNRQQSNIADFIGDSVNNYEPSFAKFPKENQKDTPSTPTEENRPKILPEKKRLLLEKLFGRNRILSSSESNSNASMEDKGEIFFCPVKKPHDDV